LAKSKFDEEFKILWALRNKADPLLQEELPSFTTLYNKINQQSSDRHRYIYNFKAEFLYTYYPKLAIILYEQQVSPWNEVCDFMERKANKNTTDLLMKKARKEVKKNKSCIIL